MFVSVVDRRHGLALTSSIPLTHPELPHRRSGVRLWRRSSAHGPGPPSSSCTLRWRIMEVLLDFRMSSLTGTGSQYFPSERYEALIRVSQAIGAHRDPKDLFRAMVSELHRVRRIGSIAVAGKSADAYCREEVRFLSLVADQAALAIVDALNFEALRNAQGALERKSRRFAPTSSTGSTSSRCRFLRCASAPRTSRSWCATSFSSSRGAWARRPKP